MTFYVLEVLYAAGQVVGDQSALAKGQRFIESYDPDAHDGQGAATGTADPMRALRFVDPVEALAFYRQVSGVRPYRPDGEPNRPLTALTVSIVPVREGAP